MAPTTTTTRRAIGIVRVSQTNGREGESFASPHEQRERIEAACQRDGLRLLDVLDELDVSGGTPLEQRAGLRAAVEAVELGRADVVVAAYFDRLVRSLRVQDELVSRVEAAGGQVLAVDVGRVTNGSAGQWLSGTMLGAVSEYQRRTAAERSAEAQARAVARGAYPASAPTGYLRGDDGVLVVDPATATAVAEAFAMRADGATIAEVRAFLGEHANLSYAAVTRLLANRAVLGEVHFGDLHNADAHDRIVDPDVFRRVQDTRVPSGRRSKSPRLLARLGILRCGSCGRPMSASTGHNGTTHIYRCGAHPGDPCPHRVTVSAPLVEQAVTAAVTDALVDVEGRASADEHHRAVEQRAAAAQAELDATLRTFTVADLAHEQAAQDRLAELREARDAAEGELRQLGRRPATLTVSGADWPRLTVAERRDLIRATVAAVTVAPGRGPGRIAVRLVGE